MSRHEHQIGPLRFVGCFAYLESDIPPGLTLAAWRTHMTADRDSARADLAPQGRTLPGARLGASVAQRA